MEIVCPACNHKMQSAKDLSGRSVKCKCGHSFRVPSQSAAASSPGKITLKCECGKTLADPASAAGKPAKCTCGRILKVPGRKAQPARVAQSAAKAKSPRAQQTTPSPSAGAFNSISEDEWSKLTVDTAPKKADPYADLLPPEEEEEKRTAADEIMDRAREEMGETKEQKKAGATNELNKARGFLIISGIANAGFWGTMGFFLTAWLDEIAAASADQNLTNLAFYLKLLVGLDVGVGVLFIVMGIFIFVFPLTCTITATVLFVGMEIFALIIDPLELTRVRGWIRRGAVIGSLITAITNAAYYNYLKKQQSQKGRKQGDY